ncbi:MULTISPECIES: PP2C family serine/threonine-protein phosphatase [Kitasatospora]|uniref:Serine/threonine protein phosphatase PstP n=1 Tax=Kitasatospora setae (strain ATCC 33774 / DSM 43861 / JCM 3304 / KCC A-0304 / NBRC 14216 / KM-6054) TaxID=452652 RepID=E4MZG5_KITSK|nr:MULTISPECIES: PP2C family serine/threonine-protein phosphatase [Kitasatospora]BAJ29739.1 putative serine/threonine protein phosphatase [Kitasatospora setae KM-6054]
MSLVLRFAAGSHKGLIREGNEDSGYAGPRLLAVSDGMGGAAAGEVASSEVLGSIVRLDEPHPGADLLTLLNDAVQAGNDRLRQMVEQDPQLEGMGCTLTALLWDGQRMGQVHIGDSRAYLLRDGRLDQITQDHTWVQRLVDEGRITAEEAETHPQRSLLMRALDGRGQVEPDLSIREVRAGDRYLICSDGLSGPVSHQTLEETLGSYYAPEQTVQELIQLALRGGGPDNITCVVADVIDVGATDPLSGQAAEAPVVVGAVADNQAHHYNDPQLLDTPAGRAAGLGRGPQPPQGAFGPAQGYGAPEGGYDPQQPGYGAPAGDFGPAEGYGAPEGGFPPAEGYGEGGYGAAGEEYGQDAPVDRRKKKRGLKLTLIGVLVLALLGAGGFFAWQWSQDQYYVGAQDGHVAVYRGLDQNLAGLDLSSVYQPYADVELKYLPAYQRDQVAKNIQADGLADAQRQVEALRAQAAVCKKVAESKTAPAAGEGTQPSAPPLTEQEQQLAASCQAQ